MGKWRCWSEVCPGGKSDERKRTKGNRMERKEKKKKNRMEHGGRGGKKEESEGLRYWPKSMNERKEEKGKE